MAHHLQVGGARLVQTRQCVDKQGCTYPCTCVLAELGYQFGVAHVFHKHSTDFFALDLLDEFCLSFSSGQHNRPVIIAVVAVRMVQVPINQVIHMVTMGYRRMAAARSVLMIGGMTGTLVLWRTGVGVCRRDANHMFIDMIPVRMVQMTIMQVVNMSFMLNSDVPAVGSMLVVVVDVVGLIAGCHGDTPVGWKKVALM